MIKIKLEDLEFMWVWDSIEDLKEKTWVVCKWGSGVLAVNSDHLISYKENAYYSVVNGLVSLKWYMNSKPIETKLTAVVKSIEEILNMEDVIDFTISKYHKRCYYGQEHNRLAGTRITLSTNPIYKQYDYSGEGLFWLKEWLKDFREEEE